MPFMPPLAMPRVTIDTEDDDADPLGTPERYLERQPRSLELWQEVEARR